MPIHSRRPPRPPSHHSCAWRLVPVKPWKANTGTSLFPAARVTICVGVFLATMMDTIHRVQRAHPNGSSRAEGRTGSPARVGGTYHPGRWPIASSGFLQSSLFPCVLACIVHTHAGSPADSAMSFHVLHLLADLSPTAFRACVAQDEKRIYIRKVPVHILLKEFSSLEANMP